ncbi:MAG: phosphopantothenoylcysteine decarboxylase [archaeon]
MQAIITSGGTIARIDDVRHLANFSSGTTGALIAEAFLAQNWDVHYVHARQAKRPFRHRLVLNPDLPLDEELDRLATTKAVLVRYQDRLHEHVFDTVEDYIAQLKELVPAADAVILAAAVSDYSPETVQGKINSDADELLLRLHKNQKVISFIKGWNARIFQVGFKLTSNAGIDTLIDTAYRHGIANHSNLTVANDLVGDDFGKRTTLIITPEKGLYPVSSHELPATLTQLVMRRMSNQHYTTIQTEQKPTIPDTFKDITQELYLHNYFEPYYYQAPFQFGFVAQRYADGFLITARASDKKTMPSEDVTYVRNVDLVKRRVVSSVGKKPSLNANVAGAIFQKRPDIHLIVHAHIFPGLENKTATEYAPGTQEDVLEIVPRLLHENGVELPRHGIIVLGNDVQDILAEVKTDNVYTTFPAWYDLLYKRFSDDKFLAYIKSHLSPQASILDLAAGTGLLAKQLWEHGYRNLSLADKQPAMLERANIPCEKCIVDLRDVHLPKRYDAIVVRQAMNYVLDEQHLVSACNALYKQLNDNGVLIFNAPNYYPRKVYPERTHTYESDGYQITITEMNYVRGRTLTHTQRCTLLGKTDVQKFYDCNRFGLFTKDEFVSALRGAGFSVAIDETSKSLLFVARAKR